MFSKNKLIISLIFSLILISSISIVSATMQIEGGAFSTNEGADDLTYASIDVGNKYSGDKIIIQIWYFCDESLLNEGNFVPKTVTSDGFINVKSADAYDYFPDNAEISIYDTDYNLLDFFEVELSPNEGIQTFGNGDYDHTYIKGSDSDIITSSNSESSENNYHTDTSSSYKSYDSYSSSKSRPYNYNTNFKGTGYPLFKNHTPEESKHLDELYDKYLADNA